jgi:hypothetical protein
MHPTGVVGALSPARQRAPQRPPPRAGVPAPGRYPVVRLAEDAWRQALAALEAAREAPYPPRAKPHRGPAAALSAPSVEPSNLYQNRD